MRRILFTDKLINVQDMVATVNIILGAPLAMRSSLRSANGGENRPFNG